MSSSTLSERDHGCVFHPCSQMQDYELFKPLEVVGAVGADIYLRNGSTLIDASSSWWCKSLGHAHPRLQRAIQRQIKQFEHVMFANTTNDTIVDLSERLTDLLPGLSKVFYAGDGSSAIEIALKMSLHVRMVEGQSQRRKIIALKQAYHGETLGALSVSDLALYRAPYVPLMFAADFIPIIPYVNNVNDPLWHDCSTVWDKVLPMLDELADVATALIIEPIVQGAGGMLIYSQDFLRRLRAWTSRHGIHLIADEIMTGMGRTGKMLACEHAGIVPDMLCLSKGLTSGWMSFSAVLLQQSIYDAFYGDYQLGKSFLHSHTYSGNALAASVALEVMKIYAEEAICQQVLALEQVMHDLMQDVAGSIPQARHVRTLGAIAAFDLVHEDATRRLGFEIYQQAVELGALLRPLGNTIYWLPPLITSRETMLQLADITQRAIKRVI